MLLQEVYYNRLRYNLLLAVEAASELNVFRMASATLSGCTCGARCPPFGTRWTEAVLPLKAFMCISSLTGAGLTIESVAFKVKRSKHRVGSHIIVDSSPDDVHR